METPDKHTLRVHLKTPERALRPEPRRADRDHLREGGPGRGRRSQEAPDRHRPVHHEGAHPQGARGAPAQSRLLRQGPPVHRRVHHPLDAGRRRRAWRRSAPARADFIWLASPSEVEVAPQDATRTSLVQSYHNTLAPFGLALAAGQAALQRRARATRDLDGHRPPEAGRHGLRGPRDSGLGRAVHLLPGQGADPEGARSLVAVPAGRGQEAHGRGRTGQGLRDDVVLLRVLPADELAGAARAAGPQEEPEHRHQDPEARLHDLLRPLRRQQVGRDVLGLPVRTRDRPRRADLSVHALEVAEELLPRQRSGHRPADDEAQADARPRPSSVR